MNHAEIESSTAVIESNGIFHLDFRGFAAETGPSPGFTNAPTRMLCK